LRNGLILWQSRRRRFFRRRIHLLAVHG
jgi:hypothetical protein